mgnify:CR=1 FL=1
MQLFPEIRPENFLPVVPVIDVGSGHGYRTKVAVGRPALPVIPGATLQRCQFVLHHE